MPYTLKKNKFKYKNPDTGNYEGVDVVAERSFADYQSALENVGLQQQTVVRSEGTTQKNAVTAAGTAASANFPATAAVCDTLAGDFAATYVPDQAYAVGDYCTYQYQLYQCKTAIAVNTDHTFVTSHWNLITVTDTINDQVDDLKTQLIGTNKGKQYISGTFSYGIFNSDTNMPVSDSRKYNAVMMNAEHYEREITIKAEDGYNFIIYYYDSNDNYLSKSTGWITERTVPANTYFRLWVEETPLDTETILDLSAVKFTIYFNTLFEDKIDTNEKNIEFEKMQIEQISNGKLSFDTRFEHGTVNTTTGIFEVAYVSYKYQAITPNLIKFNKDITIKANSGYQFQAYWYDDNDNYISRNANFRTEFIMPANRNFRLFIRFNPHSTTNEMNLSEAQVNIYYNAEIQNEIDSIFYNPLTNLPTYIKNNLKEKPLGQLSKGYILLSFDDGALPLATGTIPLLIQNDVPGTFGLLPQSAIFASGNETALATVINAITNYGCVAAMHGSALWPTYTEKELNDYFTDTKALFATKGIDNVYGAICPGGNGQDTSELVQALAGGYFGYVFSGNRADKINYDTNSAAGKFNGARTNRFDLDRKSGIGITTSNAHDIVTYAATNHLLLCPFWHDITLNNTDHAEYVTYFNNLITEAKTAGLTFITTADLPNII